DCDEVYNYWEPLHFLQFGRGKQTWEYAPQFALRSYAYLQLHNVAIKLLHLVFGFRAKGQVFYALRVVLGLVSALCETVLVRMVARYVDRRMANCTALALFGMAGLFHAAPALLPSSFAMCLGTLGLAAAMVPPTCDMRRHVWQRVVPATVAFVVAVLVGWPYAGIMAVPFFLEELLVPGLGNSGWWRWRLQRLAVLVGVGGVSTMLVVSGLVAVDSWYYGRTVFAAWNQVASGNLAWVNIALLGVAACIGVLRMAALAKYYAAPVRAFMELPAISNTTQTNELLPLGPSVKMLVSSSQKSLNEQTDERVVCMDEAWYWYPSSYWLPDGYRLQFVQQANAMQGQLPGDFIPVHSSGSVKASTSAERTDFNGLNKWEKSHVGELSTCDYLVDIEYPERSSNDKQVDRRKWRQLGECQAVLDAENSAVLARILYVPHSIAQIMEWAAGQQQKWGQMCVFQQTKDEEKH
ncbi:hypothetical protein IWW36_004657, partial [Coemansia brasiliensis]